jgi:hypothetical protein
MYPCLPLEGTPYLRYLAAMDFSRIYLYALCGAIGLLVLFIVCRFFYPLIEPSIRVRVTQFKYSKMKLSGTGFAVTGLQISSLILYLAANGFLLGVGISDLAELEQRAAAIASANLMLVFLGGRTNALADFAQIPLSTYYFGHRWIGVVATCEALLHSALALSRRQKFDALTKSGYVVSLLASCSSISNPSLRQLVVS